MSASDGVSRTAVISGDGLYRYHLRRAWSAGPRMAWVMLNPSTADGEVDDPTIRRCMGFARREGCGSIDVVNLYALRATKPTHLLDHPDPNGPDNPAWWAEILPGAAIVVAAWGAHPVTGQIASTAQNDYPGEMWERGWKHLGLTGGGHPRHPLYVRGDQPLKDLS